MLSVEYVLASPEFKPEQSVSRAAAYDIKAFIAESELPSLLRYISNISNVDKNQKRLFLNGRPLGDTVRLLCEMYMNRKIDALPNTQNYLVLYPGETKIVNAGFKVGLSTDQPDKIATMLICSRSGLACKSSIVVINAPGIIDEHYPDWVGVGLHNASEDVHIFSHGARIAQAMFLEVCQPKESVVTELSSVGERKGGFGHTGV